MTSVNREQLKILAVDDEPKILEVLEAFLESKGFRVFRACSGREAFEVLARENISLVILDLMLPDMPGEEICRAIRRKSRVPIIMLTAKIEENDALSGLQIGADDYITKPFSLKLLHARAEAVLRRSRDDLAPLIRRNSFRGGDLIVDFDGGVVMKQGVDACLTPTEMKLLSLLMKYPGKVFTRAELVELALGDEFDGYDRAVDNHIKNLRQKIEDDSRNPVYVLTVHGLGYKFGG